MTATDKLRAMLNERGVKWSNPVQMEGSEFTRWHDANGTQWTASEVTHADSKLRIGASHVTPAQAVEATLWRGECEIEYVSDWMGWHCKSCDALWQGLKDQPPRFCKECGRQVKR